MIFQIPQVQMINLEELSS
uniref:Uncharacterized protein n=1 Tax=Arundo donax TaxID=35708 RepID=A0A0A9A009_ARUDO